MCQSDETLILYLLKCWQKEALHYPDSTNVLQKTLQLTLEVIGWEFAAVSKLSENHERVELLSFVSQNEVYPNSHYDLLGTPCQVVVKSDGPVFYTDLQQRFADERDIKKLGSQSYVGMVYYIGGQPTGHIYFLDKKVYTNTQIKQVTIVLQLLSVFIGSRVELIENNKELAQQRVNAMVDPLTEVYNRRRFDQDVLRAERQYHTGMLTDAVLVMFDVDGLKAVNDNYGHLAGDKVLKFTSQLLLDSFRKEDLVYRLGGDEFAVLLFGNSQYIQNHIPQRVEIIRQALKQYNYPYVGISAGMVLLSEANSDVSRWINLADTKLYADKQFKQQRLNMA